MPTEFANFGLWRRFDADDAGRQTAWISATASLLGPSGTLHCAGTTNAPDTWDQQMGGK